MLEPLATILIVDDNADDRFLLKTALRKIGILNPVQELEDGAQAIEYLAGTKRYADRQAFPLPGLIILDLRMPRTTGLELLDWTRAHPAASEIIVAVLVGLGREKDIEAAYEHGANLAITKELSFSLVAKKIQRIFM